MNRYTQNNTKEIIYLTILSLTLALCITLTVMTGIFGVKVANTQKLISEHECATVTIQSPSDPDTQSVISEKELLYVLGEKDGKLTVYAPDRETVIDMLDTYIYSLPLSDREAVNEGIPVYSINELVSLIEDYTS